MQDSKANLTKEQNIKEFIEELENVTKREKKQEIEFNERIKEKDELLSKYEEKNNELNKMLFSLVNNSIISNKVNKQNIPNNDGENNQSQENYMVIEKEFKEYKEKAEESLLKEKMKNEALLKELNIFKLATC